MNPGKQVDIEKASKVDYDKLEKMLARYASKQAISEVHNKVWYPLYLAHTRPYRDFIKNLMREL